ncbi:SDR family oxidoreductase [Conexibacter sp. SYSU D00693]|uniref:SDR family oxidoreductase n=1 Tax=Conexibacter sp. SYSU D00693 TaxID=2812560 RepID=UPI00196B5045|nr:SDR family oxidoreductase [Conexibacter sp. SYSU D00693]
MPVAIVTASDSGIGRSAAVRLAQEGWDVGITWHTDEQGARATAAEASAKGARTALRRLDLVADAASGATVVGELADELGAVDALVNNAGGGDTMPAIDFDLATLRDVLELNVVGALACAQEAARRMRDAGTGGRIVNVTSVHEHVPLPQAAAYVAAKHALGGLTKVLALEWAAHGITVNAVAPGEVATAMTGNEDVDPHDVDRPAIPARRPGHADEVAAVIAFLCAADAQYVTGASVVADGGLSLMAAVQDGRAPS